MPTITPCLWFDGTAEAAAEHYLSLFPDSRIDSVSRYGGGAPFPAGTAMLVQFTLAGRGFQALNGGPHFRFTEAISLSVPCADQAEYDHYWFGLGDGGRPGRCGWLHDRFGVSWQIVPEMFGTLFKRGDGAATGRMMAAMMGMSRLDIAALELAYAGAEG